MKTEEKLRHAKKCITELERELAAEKLARETAEKIVEHLGSWQDERGNLHTQFAAAIQEQNRLIDKRVVIEQERDELAAALDSLQTAARDIVIWHDTGAAGRDPGARMLFEHLRATTGDTPPTR